MKSTTEHLLEQYFANALSPAESTELQQRLAEDPALRQELAWQKSLTGAFAQQPLRQHIQDEAWRATTRPPKPAVRRPLLFVSLAAAATVAALIVAFLFFRGNPVDQALATNLTHYPNRMDFKSLGGATTGQVPPPDAVRQAFEAYDDSTNYQRSADLLGKVVAQYPDRLAYRFYYGSALLHDKQYGLAITNLQPVASADTSTFQMAALYHLGLAYAGAKQYDQARTTLQQFLQAPNTLKKYRSPAEQVLAALPK